MQVIPTLGAGNLRCEYRRDEGWLMRIRRLWAAAVVAGAITTGVLGAAAPSWADCPTTTPTSGSAGAVSSTPATPSTSSASGTAVAATPSTASTSQLAYTGTNAADEQQAGGVVCLGGALVLLAWSRASLTRPSAGALLALAVILPLTGLVGARAASAAETAGGVRAVAVGSVSAADCPADPNPTLPEIPAAIALPLAAAGIWTVVVVRRRRVAPGAGA
jgi:hypothetical protein